MNVYVCIFDTIFLKIFEISSCDRKLRLNHVLEIGWNKLEQIWLRRKFVGIYGEYTGGGEGIG